MKCQNLIFLNLRLTTLISYRRLTAIIQSELIIFMKASIHLDVLVLQQQSLIIITSVAKYDVSYRHTKSVVIQIVPVINHDTFLFWQPAIADSDYCRLIIIINHHSSLTIVINDRS